MVLIPFLDRFDHMGNHTLDPKGGGVRRIEVITGVGGRRRWTSEAKARIVAESYSGELAVSEIARRHGIRPQQLFGWRHQARMGRLAVNGDEFASFVPVIADGSGEGVSCSSAAATSCVIEIELAGVIVRVRGEVTAGALAEVLAAVKRVR
jgi:transposase